MTGSDTSVAAIPAADNTRTPPLTAWQRISKLKDNTLTERPSVLRPWLAALAIFIAGSAPTAAAAATPAAIALPGDQLHPESVSITPDGVAYIGSFYGGVLKVSLKTGDSEQWITPGAFGSGSLLGVLVDPQNNLLWTCSNTIPASHVAVANSDPGSWLKGFDLKTRQGRVSLKLAGDKAVCNDIAVGPDGSVYITDTGQPRLLRWQPGQTELTVWAEDQILAAQPSGGGLDGLAFGVDGALYVNNVRSGALYRVTVQPSGKAGTISLLVTSRPLLRPDGMRPLGGMSFLLAESDGKVSRLSVKGDSVEVTTLADAINQPTGVDVALGYGWYVQSLLSGVPNKADLPFRLTPFALHR